MAPEHYGCDSAGPWTGAHAFTLADEAARTIALIDESDRKVHLVGHSYGGGVALHVALARPDRIASLTLYEPSAFHLLGNSVARGRGVRRDPRHRARDRRRRRDRRLSRGAAAFVDYWSGPGAWAALRPAVQDALTRWTPKAPLDFAALIEEPTPAGAYADRLPCAGHPRRACARADPADRRDAALAAAGRPAAVVAGAGHMGPLTHAA